MLLYYITDRGAFPGADGEQRSTLLRRITEAAQAGVDYIQLREKDLSARALEQLAREAVRAVRDNSDRTKLLINSRIDIALACSADGVHLPADDLPPSEVRTIWMKCSARPPLIGVSTHCIADVRLAESHGADFAVLAPIFEKPGTEAPALGLEVIQEACSGLTTGSSAGERFCILALGGVTLENASACLAAGTSGVAGIRLFQTGALRDTVRRLRALAASRGKTGLE
jgi:thiamine-phosphate pyrophosphorylase